MSNIQLYHGDCLAILPTLPDESVDAVVTDPPYGTTDCAFDTKIDLVAFFAAAWRVLKPSGYIIFFAAQPFTTDTINAERKLFRYELIWEKTRAVGFLDANGRPLRGHENILLLCRKFGRASNAGGFQATHNPQMTRGAGIKINNGRPPGKAQHYSDFTPTPGHNNGLYHPKSVLKFSNGNQDSPHPTAKPVDLLKWLVLSYTNAGDIVLDPFMGSGTTGVACAATGRDFIGIEPDAGYFEVARERIEAQNAQAVMNLT